MVTFIKPGDTIVHTPSSAIAAGDVVILDEKVTVAKVPIAADAQGDLSAEGLFEWPIATATAFAQGAKIYWDVADQEATEAADSGTNKLIGYAAETIVSAVLMRGYLVNNVA
jgi:predicted RecA/RadA family phage recombinase